MSADDAARRIRELEEELARERAEAARYREAAYAFSRAGPFPDDDPPTEEEIQRMLTDQSGTPILDIIAEFERGRS